PQESRLGLLLPLRLVETRAEKIGGALIVALFTPGGRVAIRLFERRQGTCRGGGGRSRNPPSHAGQRDKTQDGADVSHSSVETRLIWGEIGRASCRERV